MNVALDTNAYSDFMRGDANRVQVVRSAVQIFLPLIVVAELRVYPEIPPIRLLESGDVRRFFR